MGAFYWVRGAGCEWTLGDTLERARRRPAPPVATVDPFWTRHRRELDGAGGERILLSKRKGEAIRLQTIRLQVKARATSRFAPGRLRGRILQLQGVG
jgi:hypothetical protein